MNKKLVLTITTFVVLLGLGFSMIAGQGNVDCESRYEKVIDKNYTVEELPEECKPLPEETKDRLLLKALGSSQ